MAMLFPGYSSQYVGMTKDLYDTNRLVQEYFEEASHCLDINFVKLCFASSDIEIGKMVHAYTSLFLVNNCVYALLKDHGIKPDLLCGYSDGEISAFCAAGSFSFPDGLYLLSKYCTMYQEKIDHMDISFMKISCLSTEKLRLFCAKVNKMNDYKVEIALYDDNATHLVVGSKESITQIRQLVIDEPGVLIDMVDHAIGLHSSFAQELVQEYKMYLEKVDFKNAAIPVFSNITAKEVREAAVIKSLVLSHVISPSYFVETLDRLELYDTIILPIKAKALIKQLQKKYKKKELIVVESMKDVELLQARL